MNETVITTPAAAPSRIARARRDLAAGLTYHLAGLPLAVVAFVVAVAGFATGAGTLVVWLGVPVLALTLAASRWLADLERRATEAATGRALPPHHYRPVTGSGVVRWWRSLRDPQPWRDVAHGIAAFPVRVVGFVLAVVWTVGGVGGVLYGLWAWSLPRDPEGGGLWWLLTGDQGRAGDIALTTALGAVLLVTAPAVVRALVAVRAGLARVLLTDGAAALRDRATRLEGSRRSAVHAEAQTLRRVERDIHDGPQQRLVRLNMDLEAAARRLDDDPKRARPLLAEAITQSREALEELRALSRGIAPPILADRGLGPAVVAAAARCPVDVTLDVALPDGARLAPAVENAAYFVVTEALTNVAKHAEAAACSVAVSVDAGRVLVEVRDDGRGGAHPGKGHGLAGLADRLAAVDGSLQVDSPGGGPTVLRAAIPLEGV